MPGRGTRLGQAHDRVRTLAAAVLASTLAALLCTTAGAAEQGSTPPAVRKRAVARLGPIPGAPRAPFVVLDGEQRGVLFSYPLHEVAITELAWDRKSGTAQVRAALPPGVPAASRVEVHPRVMREMRALPLPAKVVPVQSKDASERHVAFDVAGPALQHPNGKLRLKVRALPDGAVIAHTTEEIELPPRATLEFAFGFLERSPQSQAAREPVRMSVFVCEREACERVFDEPTTSQSDASGWADRAVALPGRAGQRVTFRFEAERPRPRQATGLPVWSVPTLYAGEERLDGQPNLLLISLDTLRADHLGAYGYARDTSPFIDRELAAAGTVFEQSFSAATTTGPSHMTMFTGLAPTVHGVYGSSYFSGLSDGIPTLAEVLRLQGFETAAVTENGAMGAYRGFNRGFVSYYENKRRELEGAAGHIENTLARSLAWLDAHRDKRFFLFVHTYQVHAPYTPPTAFQGFFEGDGLDDRRADVLPSKWHPRSYDREIRYTDVQLEEFFAQLAARGLLENTLVVLVSDHGEEFLEHGALGHGPALHDEVLRVPLIVRGPGVAAGRRVKEPVSLVDLMATLLELAGLDPAAAPGQSFARSARAQTLASASAPRPIFSEARGSKELFLGRRGGMRTRQVEVPGYAVRVGDRKLIRNLGDPGRRPASTPGSTGPTYLYFDLAADPAERRDLIGSAGADAPLLRRLLESYVSTGEAKRASHRESVRTETGTPGVLDADRRAKLRALGYLE